jgi:hypothetical protein
VTNKVKLRLADALTRAAGADRDAGLVCPFHAMRVACPSGSADYFVCRELVGLLLPGGATTLSRLCQANPDSGELSVLPAVAVGSLLRGALATPSDVDSIVRKWL